jgi:hypothetical protein
VVEHDHRAVPSEKCYRKRAILPEGAWKALEKPDEVVSQYADSTSDESRKVSASILIHPRITYELADRLQRIALVVTKTTLCLDGTSVEIGPQDGVGTDPDEGVSPQSSIVLGAFEKTRRASTPEFEECRNRGLGIGRECPVHWDHDPRRRGLRFVQRRLWCVREHLLVLSTSPKDGWSVLTQTATGALPIEGSARPSP